MRSGRDGRIGLWPLHLARLRRDCGVVGFPLDEDAVADRLGTLPIGRALRVRLTVEGSGRVGLACEPLPPAPPFWTVALSPVRLESSDPWLRIKTSWRPQYDAARRLMPEGTDEAILMNESDEICEGTITTLFLRRGPSLLTPPLSCGLLPGILRQSLLDAGEAREAPLVAADLSRGELFCGNALRGLIPARLVRS
ncbi:aminotransferase class IV [Paracoccus sp. EGI L200073]|nr:aminotransferase class IV [Paracoccus salsus]MCF3973996.1 aminotransferase class IV [Paracoccus salsus]